MASYVTPEKGAPFVLGVGLLDQSDTTQLVVNPTLAAGDFQVSIDFGALNNLTTLPVVTPAASRAVRISLSAPEMDGDNIVVIGHDVAGAEWCDIFINIQTTARQIDDLAFPNTSGRGVDVDASGGVEVGSFQNDAITAAAIATGAIDADAIADDAIDAGAIAANAITAAKIATDAITSDELADSATAEIAASVWAYATRTLTSFGTLAADVWAYATRTLTSFGTLAATLADAVWDETTSGHTTSGTFGEMLGDVDAEVWTYATRTLTAAAASTTATVSGSAITIQRGDTLSASLTGLGTITGYTTLDWTVKENKRDTDANAIIRIRLNASGTGDGLLRFNKAAVTDATLGSITIDDAADGDITIALSATVTDDLQPAQNLYYDVQIITPSAVTTMTENRCSISEDVTRAVT